MNRRFRVWTRLLPWLVAIGLGLVFGDRASAAEPTPDAVRGLRLNVRRFALIVGANDGGQTRG